MSRYLIRETCTPTDQNQHFRGTKQITYYARYFRVMWTETDNADLIDNSVNIDIDRIKEFGFTSISEALEEYRMYLHRKRLAYLDGKIPLKNPWYDIVFDIIVFEC